MNRAVYLLLLALGAFTMRAAEPAKPMTTTNQTELATLGGGCFWCLEAAFELLPGVKNVVNGFAGGHTANPTYQEVCTQATGHAEVVQIEFDSQVISYEKLLETFWLIHDPTTLNRQGNDIGTHYRSIILFHNDGQKQAAQRAITEVGKRYSKPVVTQLVELKQFYRAEEYHQDYFRKNPTQAYCQAVVRPKVEKVKKMLKDQAQ